MHKAYLTNLAAEFEAYLGDPHDPGSRMPFSRILELDEAGQYPYSFVSQLRRWGTHEYSMPTAQGGRGAGNVETGFQLMRLVARRDPTTATALVVTNLAFMPVWIAGSDEQKRYLIEEMKRGGCLSWGLSERAHGSDLLANEMRAEKVEGGYLLTGEKWLIGNATVGDKMSVFARTGERIGPAAFSVFVLEKWKTPAETIEELPMQKLHGLRAMDLSGLRLNRAFVPDSALLGAEGQGLEITLKATQTARAVISSLAMSAVDTALRHTLDFTEGRILRPGRQRRPIQPAAAGRGLRRPDGGQRGAAWVRYAACKRRPSRSACGRRSRSTSCPPCSNTPCPSSTWCSARGSSSGATRASACTRRCCATFWWPASPTATRW